MSHFKNFIPLVLILLLASCKMGDTVSEKVLFIPAEGISIIPKPTELNFGNATLITPAANILCYNAEAEEAAEWLFHLLNKANLDLYKTPVSPVETGTWI
ncbi:hypothetical protein FK178_12270 [Antarcticibacterium arcticum]|uniref:Uncharacterized protein n=1 Tax=Antarcticibacterium arcticum TaxID=2585771 RepID=A0A5B8YKM0_9FLAO|nr:hypothetical protein [Antarcticibacterium arcticum]QED38442.1 hypothetical protein FK178_12270 [Antarcticibacterium arcticum]